jgi:hypothetical protein
MTDHEEDPGYHDWLDDLNEEKRKNLMRSCGQCAYSIKEDMLRLGSPLYCYNRNCSHVDGNWTSCVDARDIEWGLCGAEGKFYKAKMKEEA